MASGCVRARAVGAAHGVRVTHDGVDVDLGVDGLEQLADLGPLELPRRVGVEQLKGVAQLLLVLVGQRAADRRLCERLDLRRVGHPAERASKAEWGDDWVSSNARWGRLGP